jgi:hypothetical protein
MDSLYCTTSATESVRYRPNSNLSSRLGSPKREKVVESHFKKREAEDLKELKYF